MSVSGQSVFAAIFVGFLIMNICSADPVIEILDVRTNSDRSLLTSDVSIHNRSWFDLNFTVHQEFVGHTLYLGIHLKAEVNQQWQTYQRWKNIDLCRFLSGEKPDPLLNFMFENALKNRSFLLCPFRVGVYSIKDAYLDAKRIPPLVPKTRYRFFLEVSQMMGDAAKLFSIKIDAVYCAS